MKVRSMSILIIAADVITLLFAQSSVAADPTWVPGPPMQTPRSGASVTLGKDGFIYVIGGKAYGCDDTYTIDTVERFDEATNRWEYIRHMAKRRVFAGAVTDSDGQIWAVGGHGPGEIYDTVEIYNPASDSWTLYTQQRKLKTRRTNHGIVIMPNGCMYVFGGTSEWSESGWLRSAEKYNPETQKWDYVASMHEARTHPGVGLDEDGRIYACGGASWTGPVDTVERYDPDWNTWEYVARLPEPMGNPAGFTLNGEIWVVGGWQRGGGATYTSSCYIYSPSSDSWREGPRMFEPVGNTQAAVSLSGTVYLVEGEATDIWPTDKIAILNPATGWSFAIITDLHIGDGQSQWVLYPPPLGLVYDWWDYDGVAWDDDGSNADTQHAAYKNLQEAVDLINDYDDVKFVLLLGDFTDSAELSEMNKAKELLDGLDDDIPWLPLIGNHDTWPMTFVSMASLKDSHENGADQYFNDVFGPQYVRFWEKLGSFNRLTGRTLNLDLWWWPEGPCYNYFQNFTFDYGDCHFVALDFCARNHMLPIKGQPPDGALYDFEGASWFELKEHLQNFCETPGLEDVILLSHHPFRNFKDPVYDVNMGFDETEMGKISSFLKNYKDRVRVQFAGHSHPDGLKVTEFGDDILQIIETPANVNEPTVAIVTIYPGGNSHPRIDYSKVLPENGFCAKSNSPVDLEITDPNGLVISKHVNQIPNAFYCEQDTDDDGFLEDSVYIRERKAGDYKIRVAPEPNANPTDTYSLEVSMVEESSGWAPITIAEDVHIEQTPTQPYSFRVKERELARVNYSGDLSGEYRATVTLSASLTDVTHVNRLADKTILFKLGASSIQAVTDTNGIATVPLTLDQRPSEYYYVDVSFSGDASYLPATDSEPFTFAPPSVDECVSVKVGGPGYDRQTNQFGVDVTITNTSSKIIEIPLWLVVKSTSDPNVALADNDGVTPDGKAYTSLSNLLLDNGQLDPQESITKRIYLSNPRSVRFTFEPSVRGVIVEELAPGPLEQLSGLSTHWLGSEASLDIAPVGGDGIVNFRDFALMAEGWLNSEE